MELKAEFGVSPSLKGRKIALISMNEPETAILRRIIIKNDGIIIPELDYQTFAFCENRHFSIF